MWLGLGVVTLGAALGAFLMFGQHANPRVGTAPTTVGTLSGDPSGATRPLTAPSGAVPRAASDGDVRIRWYQRIRAGLVLLLITVGLGMAIGAVIGAGALAVNLLLG